MNCPVTPLIIRIGPKAATLVRIVARTGLPTWRTPSIAASRGEQPSSIRRKTFSPTTMASSTTMPSTTMKANIVIMFMVTPAELAISRPPRKATGMPSAVTSATRRLRKSTREISTRRPPTRPESRMTSRRFCT